MTEKTPEQRQAAIIEEFGSVSHAARKLGFTRPTIYRFINEGVNDSARDRIKGRGYNPDTFKRLTEIPT